MSSARFTLSVLLVVAIVLGGSWFIHQRLTGRLSFNDLTPAPLYGPREDRDTTLTVAGVFSETNKHRQQNGLQALTQNNALNNAAAAKLADMFSQQYFDHKGPDGKQPADWVKAAGYRYLRVGENLALGNFGSDAELVQAWMDSPGHRANIVSSHFTELGVAVGRGTFEGKQTWLAVQSFGQPESVCPKPNETLQQSVSQNEQSALTLRTELTQLEDEINQLSRQLEAAIVETKRLAEAAKTKIEEGNAQIEEGNRINRETGSREQAEPYWQRGEALQNEGRELFTQAEAKQNEARKLNDEITTLQATYNTKATTLQQVSTQLRQLVDRFNNSIRIFNRCLES